MCAGVNTCVFSGVATSFGPALVDTTFTPSIGVATDFTFGSPFTFFFFISGRIQSSTSGTLTPGELSANFANSLQLLSVSVVDANGDPIPGAVINSEFLDQSSVPEPGTFFLLAGGSIAAAVYRRFSAR